MVKAKVYKLVEHFDGYPKKSDFKLVEEDLRPIKDGEFLAEAEYISVDPYIRTYSTILPLGETVIGLQVARIIESKNPQFPVGKHAVLYSGWRSHTISDGVVEPGRAEPYLLPDIGNLSPSLGLGVLGMPGNTAYFLFMQICDPKPSETVVVSGAAGGIGSIVGQIAKIKGCKVIGLAGTDDKGKWLTDELGFDYFINYKTQNIDQELSRLAPEGVDCYFDNVGGSTSAIIIKHMNNLGRIAQCGFISGYNEKDLAAQKDYSAESQKIIDEKHIRAELRLVYDNVDKWMDGINQLYEWMQQGKLKYRETITNGFDHLFDAFLDMLQGGNTGKAIVKI